MRREVTTGKWWVLAPIILALALGIGLYPGRWTSDTASEYFQVRSGHFDDWYGTVFLAFVRLFFLVVPHFGLMLLVQATVLGIGVFGICRAILSRASSAVVAVAVMLFPPVLGWEIVLSRDVWYGVLLLSGAASLQSALFSTRNRFARAGFTAIALAQLVLLAAVRQNGVIGALPLIAFGLWRLTDRAPRFSLRKSYRLAIVGGGTLAVAVVVGASVRVITYDALHATHTHIEESLYIYDLAAVSQRTHTNLFPMRRVPASRFPKLEASFDPDNIDSVLWGEGAFFDVGSFSSSPSLAPAWRRLVVHRPADYLEARAHIFGRLIGVAAPAPVWTFQPRAASSVLKPTAFGWPNRIADQYLNTFDHSLVQRAAIYLVLIAAFLAAAVRRGPRYQFVGAVGMAAVFNEVSFFFLTTVVANRFSWVMIVAGLVCGAGLLRIAASQLRRGGPVIGGGVCG